jgi:hypothetical protein
MITKEGELHAAIIRHVAERGFAPFPKVLQEQLGWSESALEGALTRLAEIRGVILKPNSGGRMGYSSVYAHANADVGRSLGLSSEFWCPR